MSLAGEAVKKNRNLPVHENQANQVKRSRFIGAE